MPAEKHLAELIHQLDNGTYIKPGKPTLAEYLERWLKEYSCPNLAPGTTEGYESIIRSHIIPALGKIPLIQLKPEHLQRHYSEKLSAGRYDGKGALSQTTVSHHHTCLHRALKMEPAVRFELTTGGLRNRCSTPELRWQTESPEIIPLNRVNQQRFPP